MSSKHTSGSECPVCRSTDITDCVGVSQMPIHCNLLWSTRSQALAAPRGGIQLEFCRECGHLFNSEFDPDLMEYDGNYENSLHFSPRFQHYASRLATNLIERHDLHEKQIIEIGCGRGDFLKLLCELGDNYGIGFDPSYVPEPGDNGSAERVTFVQDFYSERYAHHRADFVCSRHTLEHIHAPLDFLVALRRAIGTQLDAIIFFEVPNALSTLRDLAIWDIIYEHCSYFSSYSLARVFVDSGFNILDVGETFAGQFLCIEARPSNRLETSTAEPRADLEKLTCSVAAFGQKYRSRVDAWRSALQQMEQSGQKAVVWGAGSKGVTFLNTLKIQDQIEYVVDINPRKHGRYVAGTGQQIVPSEFLQDYQPDLVIVMNSIYLGEIKQRTDSLGLAVDLVCA